MIIKSCFNCEHHRIKVEGGEEKSYCSRENCWARYSKCVAQMALHRFLEQERLGNPLKYSALDPHSSLE